MPGRNCSVSTKTARAMCWWAQLEQLAGKGWLNAVSLAVVLAVGQPGLLLGDAGVTLAVGAKLYVRLETPASTKTSHLHEPMAAKVVRETTCDQGVVIPMGAEVSGQIVKLIPASDPTDRARLLIRFDQLLLPRHAALALAARLTEVENAREKVLPDGTIQGVVQNEAAVGRMDTLLDRLGSPGSEMERMSGKAFGKIDTSIDLPVGADLVLMVDQPVAIDGLLPSAPLTVSTSVAEAIQKLLPDAPTRAENKAKKPGDPLNLIIVGSLDQIVDAFTQAGWSTAKRLGVRSAAGTVRAMASDQGYGEAPVSQLYLYGRSEDLAFEKMLDTFMKRHHLRLWRTDRTTADGRPIWLGASTHDIGLDVHPGVVSHAIDPDLDAERTKVGADLTVAGSVAAEQLVTPPNHLSEGRTATGGPWKTDGRLLLIELKSNETI